MEHDLKTWPAPFEAVLDGRKRYEVRRADRTFAVGDTLLLREWRPGHEGPCKFERPFVGLDNACALCKRRIGESLPGEYTGREFRVRVTYLTPENVFGVPKGYVVLGIEPADTKAVDDPWREFADAEHENCGLCGNTGVIDTRGRLETPAGVPCGVLGFCLCPNGRAWKKGGANLEALAGRQASIEDWKARAERAEALVELIRTRLTTYEGDVNLLVLLGEITAMVGGEISARAIERQTAAYHARRDHERALALQAGDRMFAADTLEANAADEAAPFTNLAFYPRPLSFDVTTWHPDTKPAGPNAVEVHRAPDGTETYRPVQIFFDPHKDVPESAGEALQALAEFARTISEVTLPRPERIRRALELAEEAFAHCNLTTGVPLAVRNAVERSADWSKEVDLTEGRPAVLKTPGHHVWIAQVELEGGLESEGADARAEAFVQLLGNLDRALLRSAFYALHALHVRPAPVSSPVLGDS